MGLCSSCRTVKEPRQLASTSSSAPSDAEAEAQRMGPRNSIPEAVLPSCRQPSQLGAACSPPRGGTEQPVQSCCGATEKETALCCLRSCTAARLEMNLLHNTMVQTPSPRSVRARCASEQSESDQHEYKEHSDLT
eukprot:2285501-Amphidinium_carterae.1